MEAVAKYHINDSAETVDNELTYGMCDSLLELHNQGRLPIDEIKNWYNTGELSDIARTALAEAAMSA